MAATEYQTYPVTLEERLKVLADSRSRLMAEIEMIQAGGASPSVEPTRWSLNEIVYHLHLAESGIARFIEKALQSEDRHTRFSDEELQAEWEKIRMMVGSRERRANAPERAVPIDAPELAEAIRRLQQSRQKLLEVLSRTSLDELASISRPHGIEAVGMLTGAGWISLIAYHERRHTEQIRELKTEMDRP